MATEDASYVDYEALLDPNFSAVSFANKLVLETNNPKDYPQDLSTPLSKVLFDVQEIDTHIDTLTSKSALHLLEYSTHRADASQKILQQIEAQVDALSSTYQALQRDIVDKYEAAQQGKLVAERLNQTVRLARSVARALLLGRQLERQLVGTDVHAMVRAAHTVAVIRTLLLARKPGEEGHGLEKVWVISTLVNSVIMPAERLLVNNAQQTVREFSMSSLLTTPSSAAVHSSGGVAITTFSQNEETKSRVISAILVLYLLSPVKPGSLPATFEPSLALSILQEYIQLSLKSSTAAITRSLATLPNLDKTLAQVSARCQNIVALEQLLAGITPPSHPAFEEVLELEPNATKDLPPNLLQPLLASLDTSSLPSVFWRNLASSLSPRVNEILAKGGVSARTLRANKDGVRDAIRSCVHHGSQIPETFGKKQVDQPTWEREANFMAASVCGPLRR